MTPREILEEAKRRIVADPKKYDQNTFCGTPCCIAGHIDCILNGEQAHAARLREMDFYEAVDFISEQATTAIGETTEPWLFRQVGGFESEDDEWDSQEDECWPPDLSIAYEDSKGAERAAVACKAIDRYMEERGL